MSAQLSWPRPFVVTLWLWSLVTTTAVGLTAPPAATSRADVFAVADHGEHRPLSSERPSWLRAVPPAIRLPSAPAFDAAIAPWQAGNYGGAAYRLDALAARYPRSEDVAFYQGVAWLLAGVPDAAIAPLERVGRHPRARRRAEAAWYLGLAHLERDRAVQAHAAFAAACLWGWVDGCRAARVVPMLSTR